MKSSVFPLKIIGLRLDFLKINVLVANRLKYVTMTSILKYAMSIKKVLQQQ